MKLRILTAVASVLLMALMAAGATWAADSPGSESPASSVDSAPPMPGPEMMKMMGQALDMQKMMKRMGAEHGMLPPASARRGGMPAAGLQMMDSALSGRMSMAPGAMRQMMDRAFYLDRVTELGLNAEQVKRLRTIQGACRRDNIRTGAEIRIARLDLDDLLSSNNWTLDAAEKLVRHQQKLEGDMQVRHLQALVEARRVLTPEQLQKAQADTR